MTVAVLPATRASMPQAAPAPRTPPQTDSPARAEALDRFLRGVERRALRMAQLSATGRDEAFDVVQDAMLDFVRNYRGHPDTEWPLLFWRVLDSRLLDRHRRRKVRSRWLAWLGPAADDDNNDDDSAIDPLANLPDTAQPGPFLRLADAEAMASLETALRALPLRQRQAFLLRVWEDFDVAHTAQVMQVSEGSVKTHLFRALRHLRLSLEAHR